MQFTGERLHSDINEYWATEHYHRYAIANQLVENRIVLDLASGEGYGSHFLAKKAKHVTGVDLSSEAVEFSRANYKADNLKYLVGSADKIPLENQSVDVVVSFETIEHHDKHHEMMGEIKRVLKNPGCLVISSPDKRYYSDVPGYINPFHIKELYKDEFQALIQEYFKSAVYYSQKSVYGSLIVADQTPTYPSDFVEYSGDINKIVRNTSLQEPVYNIAICSDSNIENIIIYNSFFSSELTISKLNQEINRLKGEIVDMSQNRSFKVGKLITAPYRYIRKIFK